MKCEECDGTGYIFHMTNHEDVSEGYETRCSACNGKGTV